MAEVVTTDCHDVASLLSSPDRDFLIRNTGDQVKVASLKGKKIALYFSASWCGPCKRFTPVLTDIYTELQPKGDFEIIFISADEDNESFDKYFSKMPWLAIPFSDSEKRENLDELFKVRGIPHLVMVDESGKVTSDNGVEIIQEYGVEGYPFTSEKIKQLKDQEEEARKNQSLKSILVHQARDFLLSSNGSKVPISELEGKIVALCFMLSSYKACLQFTPKLLDLYNKLKAKDEKFEVVLVPLDDDEEPLKQILETTSWFSIPIKDKSCQKLARYFELSTLPTVVIIGSDGKTVNTNVAEAVEEHGVIAYPFTPEKFAELAEMEKAKEESQTLESVLVSGDLDYVIGKNGAKVPISNLVGKTILLYFSAHWCPPCRAFLPKLMETYHKIKETDDAFEVIFISSDRDQTSFDEFFAGMPWLALPFGDKRKSSLSRSFKVQGIPMVVALDPTGKTITKEARGLIMTHGSDAYPFTDDQIQKLVSKFEEMAKGWPEKVMVPQHEHELVLTRRVNYNCDGCGEGGSVWSFFCDECDYDLHPKCALTEEKPEGWVCDGDVCHKA